MTYAEVMATLKSMGSPQTVKTYQRHGAEGEMFGVSMANLTKLQKSIKQNTELARQLWDSCNVDARVLAMQIADPQEITAADADRWMKDVRWHMLGDYLARLIARASLALRKSKMRQWMKSKKEHEQACGYSLLAWALQSEEDISDSDCASYLETIEKEIHSSPNRARYAMNGALIAIGGCKPSMTQAALKAAERIGNVEVDHGDTSCQTPNAADYIRKMVTRRKSSASPRKKGASAPAKTNSKARSGKH